MYRVCFIKSAYTPIDLINWEGLYYSKNEAVAGGVLRALTEFRNAPHVKLKAVSIDNVGFIVLDFEDGSGSGGYQLKMDVEKDTDVSAQYVLKEHHPDEYELIKPLLEDDALDLTHKFRTRIDRNPYIPGVATLNRMYETEEDAIAGAVGEILSYVYELKKIRPQVLRVERIAGKHYRDAPRVELDLHVTPDFAEVFSFSIYWEKPISPMHYMMRHFPEVMPHIESAFSQLKEQEAGRRKIASAYNSSQKGNK